MYRYMIYIYIYMYTHIYIYIYLYSYYLCLYVSLSLCFYIYVSVSLYLSISVSLYPSISLSLSVSISVSISISTCICVGMSVYICIETHVQKHKYIQDEQAHKSIDTRGYAFILMWLVQALASFRKLNAEKRTASSGSADVCRKKPRGFDKQPSREKPFGVIGMTVLHHAWSVSCPWSELRIGCVYECSSDMLEIRRASNGS